VTRRHPAGSRQGGRFAPDTRGKTPPQANATATGALPAGTTGTAGTVVDPSSDTRMYEQYVQARYAFPLADDLRAHVYTALAGSPWADAPIDTSAARFSRTDAGVIAAALNHRVQTWPRDSRSGPDAAVVKSLYLRFSRIASGG
jgi:hypothetical protein